MDTVAAEAGTVAAVVAAEVMDHVALVALAVHSIANRSSRSMRPTLTFVWELGAAALGEAFVPVRPEPAVAPQ